MKTRTGFVSNSSAASFCIYGWTEKDLGIKWGQVWDLVGYIWENTGIRLEESNTPADGVMIGVGCSESEIDHYYCEYTESGYNENWEDYRSPPPIKKQMEWLDEVAKDLGLPQPHLDSATWFDG